MSDKVYSESHVPNLDAMSEKELMVFWRHYHRPGRNDAKALVGTRKGAVRIAQTLASYASNKATAMSCRLRGDIQAAMIYENFANRLYEKLPEDLKW